MSTANYYTYDKSLRMTSILHRPLGGAGVLDTTNFTHSQRNMVTQIQELDRDHTQVEPDRTFSYNSLGDRVFGYDGYTGTSYWAWDGPRLTCDNFNRLGTGYGSNKYRWDDRELIEIGPYNAFDGVTQLPDLDPMGSVKHLKLAGESYETNAALVRIGATTGTLGNRLQNGSDHFARLNTTSQELLGTSNGAILMTAIDSAPVGPSIPSAWPGSLPIPGILSAIWKDLEPHQKNRIFRITRLDCPQRAGLVLVLNGGIWLLTADSWAPHFSPVVVQANCLYSDSAELTPPQATAKAAPVLAGSDCPCTKKGICDVVVSWDMHYSYSVQKGEDAHAGRVIGTTPVTVHLVARVPGLPDPENSCHLRQSVKNVYTFASAKAANDFFNTSLDTAQTNPKHHLGHFGISQPNTTQVRQEVPLEYSSAPGKFIDAPYVKAEGNIGKLVGRRFGARAWIEECPVEFALWGFNVSMSPAFDVLGWDAYIHDSQKDASLSLPSNLPGIQWKV